MLPDFIVCWRNKRAAPAGRVSVNDNVFISVKQLMRMSYEALQIIALAFGSSGRHKRIG